jgi:hypothetical protein
MDEGRKCGEAEVVFLSRLENVMSFGFMRLRRFLNVGLSRLDFSSPFACSWASKEIALRLPARNRLKV